MTHEEARLFEVLLRDHERMLMGYVRCLVRDSGLAEDVFQETFVVAWRRFGDFDSTRPLGPWLRGIALRVARAAARKSASDRHVFHDGLVAEIESRFDADGGDSDRFADEQEALAHCMSQLAKPSVQLVDQRYRQSMSATQIAKQAGRTPNAVRKELGRIRKALERCIKKRLSQPVGEPL